MLEKLRYLTSGESHGQALACVIDGIPANLSLSAADINPDLARRQKGYGRGGRMKIESDTVQLLSGIRHGKTLGSPITLLIENRDWANWCEIMNPEQNIRVQGSGNRNMEPVTRPRPGHADLSGALKYNTHDIRNILERSSARETAARVAAGAVAKKFLSEFNIKIISYVTEIGGQGQSKEHRIQNTDFKALLSIFKKAEASPVRCPDEKVEKKMIGKITHAMKKGDTIGGVFEVVVLGVPPGLGSYIQWDKKLDAKLTCSLMSIQAIKGVEIGLGFEMSRKHGSEVMDEIFYEAQKRRSAKVQKSFEQFGFYRKTNNAGGIEGGMSNGMPVIIRAAMKPIPTLKTPLSSIDILSRKPFKAAYERSDVCAVPAASVIGEAVTALAIADSLLVKFGGDSMEEAQRNYQGYLRQLREF
ncbi:MAG: chorismate synthase [Nitrospiraceae bacterium]|nr:MAG: chorismate synthase [Nitrospiraceae bacterium]